MGIETGIAGLIEEALSGIEKDEDVTILYACESGSRAWGFESADSDYDVRFVYVRRTRDYLSIVPGRDVIELPVSDVLDVNGWDLSKALDLFRRSNPALLEWVQSPIVYRSCSSLLGRLQALLPRYYSPIACMHHYLHMAEGNLRQYLKGEEVWTKKYFYVLRPVLACLWIERGLGPVPMEFQRLVDAVVDDGALRAEIDALLATKRMGDELRHGPRNEVISSFLEGQVERLRSVQASPSETRSRPGARAVDELNRVFVEVLVDVNGERV